MDGGGKDHREAETRPQEEGAVLGAVQKPKREGSAAACADGIAHKLRERGVFV